MPGATVLGRRILIVSWDGGGAAVPAYNLGRRLLRAGHDVHLLGWPDQRSAARDAGLGFSAYPCVPPWPPGVSQDAEIDRVFGYLAGEQTSREITDAVHRLRPDVLVIDAMMRAAYDAARRSGLPTVVLCHVLASLYSGAFGESVMGRPTAGLLSEAALVLALTRREFDADGAHPTVSYVGPITRPDVDASRAALAAAGLAGLTAPGEPWVLASLSTTVQNQAEMLPALLDALAEVPARVLLTLGGVVDPDSLRTPPHVHACGFVPHEQVLPHVSAVVSHGGLSGISTALSHGVPLVCLPQGRDQAHNAARVVASGVGVETDLGGLPLALRTVLEDPAYLAAAARFRDPRAGEEATRLVARLAP